MIYKTLLKHTENNEWLDVRSMFPFLVKNPDDIFMNNAAITLVPEYVLASLHDCDDQPLTAYRSFSGYEYEEIISIIRQRALKLFSLDHHVAFFGNNSSDVTNKISMCLRKCDVGSKTSILLSLRNHHSNLVPWIYFAQQRNLKIEWFDSEQDLSQKINHQTFLVALPHISNVTGERYRVSAIFQLCLPYNVLMIVDATQSCLYEENLNLADMVFFSSQKYFAHSGVGVGMLSERLQNMLKIDIGGGGTIHKINLQNDIILKSMPYALEYGTYNALSLLSLYFAFIFRDTILNKLECRVHLDKINRYFIEKYNQWTDRHDKLPLFDKNKVLKPIFSFNIPCVNAHDVSDELTRYKIHNRAGNHCASQYFPDLSSVRISLTIYNGVDEIDVLFDRLNRIRDGFKNG